MIGDSDILQLASELGIDGARIERTENHHSVLVGQGDDPDTHGSEIKS